MADKNIYWTFPKGKPAPINYLWDGKGWRKRAVGKDLSDEQLAVCNRIAEAIYDEDEARNMYPELNKDFVSKFKDTYDDMQLIGHIAKDEDHHWHDLMKIYNKRCK